jgi:hypothetical protein
LTFIAESPSVLPELAQRLTRRLNYHSGHAGFAVNWNETGDDLLDAQETMFVVSQRYIGIDLSELSATMSAIPDGIKCVNWLTLLSAEHVDRLGGAGLLRRQLGPDVPVHKVGSGIVIQAGSRPETGDVNYGRTLPLYRRVGRAVADIRAKTHAPFLLHGDDVYDEELTEEWLGRFDK